MRSEELTNQKNQLQAWLDGNITEYQDYISTHHRTDSEYDNLQSQIKDLQNKINALESPKLIGTIDAKDNTPWLGTPYLHVEGFICNVGNYPASNAKLYVQAFQKRCSCTFILMGTIDGEGVHYVKSDITYTGDKLTKCHIWSEPAAIDWWWHYS